MESEQQMTGLYRRTNAEAIQTFEPNRRFRTAEEKDEESQVGQQQMFIQEQKIQYLK